MAGEMDILKVGFEKAAEIPESKPKWGTTPESDLPGEHHPEGVDENHPVGDDAQNKRYLQASFSSAEPAEADARSVLRDNFENFDRPSRLSHSQLIKDFPKTPRTYQAMAGVLQRKLQG